MSAALLGETRFFHRPLIHTYFKGLPYHKLVYMFAGNQRHEAVVYIDMKLCLESSAGENLPATCSDASGGW